MLKISQLVTRFMPPMSSFDLKVHLYLKSGVSRGNCRRAEKAFLILFPIKLFHLFTSNVLPTLLVMKYTSASNNGINMNNKEKMLISSMDN